MNQEEQRRIMPIYEALDIPNYRLAIQHSNKVLKKSPNHHIAKALVL
jgi:hypothetical protein